MREVILDTETIGLNPALGHRIIEIGCVEIFNKAKTGRVFHYHINPERDVPQEAFKIHGLSTEFLKDKPLFKEIAPQLVEFIADSTLVIHNAPFDVKFLNAELKLLNHELITMERVIDTLVIARKKFPGAPASLDALCRKFKVNNTHRTKHGALLDSELLYEVYIALTEGVQSELKLQEERLEGKASQGKIKQAIPYRQFPVDKDELESHEKLIAKIKNSLWEDMKC